MIDPDELIPAAEAAELLRLEPSTLADWRCDDKGPGYVRLGKRIFYRREDIAEWIGAQRHEPRRVHARHATVEAMTR
jgi:Helix-turn-helix domain